VATLKRGSFYHAGGQRMLHFDEKNGKSREIPVRHDLEQMITEYIEAAGLRAARKAGRRCWRSQFAGRQPRPIPNHYLRFSEFWSHLVLLDKWPEVSLHKSVAFAERNAIPLCNARNPVN
jgi:hypothetical protein